MIIATAIFTENLCFISFSNTDENGQKYLFSIKTVGRVKYRYRLVHRWVAEMLLNVQSVSSSRKKGTRHYIL